MTTNHPSDFAVEKDKDSIVIRHPSGLCARARIEDGRMHLDLDVPPSMVRPTFTHGGWSFRPEGNSWVADSGNGSWARILADGRVVTSPSGVPVAVMDELRSIDRSRESLPQTTELRRQLIELHHAYDHSVGLIPERPSDDEMRLRASLIIEEAIEAVEAIVPGYFTGKVCEDIKHWIHSRPIDVSDQAFELLVDALADIDVVVEGTRVAIGVHGSPVAREVHRSNMAKVGPTGKVEKDENGKVRKPAGWTPPDIEGVLRAQGWHPTDRSYRR